MAISSAEVLEIFDESDTMALDLATAGSLHCPPGCGACCLSPTIEVLPLEFLPLTEELVRRGELLSTLAQVEQLGQMEHLCFWYRSKADPLHGGHCSIYPWRPLVCRCFGYFPVLVKGTAKILAACHTQKVGQGASVAKAQHWINERNTTLSTISDQGQKLALLDPSPSGGRLLINAALREALSYEAAQQYFASMAEDSTVFD